MAARFPTLLLFPSFCKITPHPLRFYPQSSNLYSNPTRKHFTLCASAAKKPRVSRKIMSDEELCNDIREFSNLHGLEVGQVPPMKELSANGRKDLANIVRRRGYKLVGELLLKSLEMKADAILDEQIGIPEDTTDRPLGQDENVLDEIESPLLGTELGFEKSKDMMNCVDKGPTIYNQIDISSDIASTVNLVLEEKVSNFIYTGDLDILEDELKSSNEDIPGKDECIKLEGENSFSTQSQVDIKYESNEQVVSGQSNGRTPIVMPRSAERNDIRDVNPVPTEKQISKDDLELEMRGRENQDEINHLKFELHQKELELSKLKELVEKEKLVLFQMQAKVEAEINKAMEMVAEKDTELSTLEEHLGGLKEVQIQYKGEGSTVEVAGSFNGWHHQIKMESQPLSTLQESAESRTHRFWSTTLWLYPGVYEVKFIVDGHWRVDPQSESVTRGSIHNNILRVER